MNLYVVKSHDNKYFRAKGYGGHGESWVAEMEKARIYAKIGPARATVSWWVNNYPKIPGPYIIQLEVIEGKEIPTDAEKIKLKKLRSVLKQKENELKYYERTQNEKVARQSELIKELKREIGECKILGA